MGWKQGPHYGLSHNRDSARADFDGGDDLDTQRSPAGVQPGGDSPAPFTILELCRHRAGLETHPDLPGGDPDRPSVRVVSSGRHLSFRDWYADVEPMAAYLLGLGLVPGDRVLLLSETRMEWMQADLAIMAAGGLTVPVYPTLPSAQIEEILVDSDARFAVVSRPGLLAELAGAPSAAGRLEGIVLVEGRVTDAACCRGSDAASESVPSAAPEAVPAGVPSAGLATAPSAAPAATPSSVPAGDAIVDPAGDRGPKTASAAEQGLRPVPWAKALQAGRDALAIDTDIRWRLESVRREIRVSSPATIIYTSGTEGIVKGAVLSHGNLLASAVSSAKLLEITQRDLYLSFLPLSHVLERVVQFSMIWAGASIHYCEGLDRLEANLRSERPTVVVGVPRFYEKILREARVKAREKGKVAELLFRMAERAALRAGRRGPGSRPPLPGRVIWNALVYRKIRKVLGGRIRRLISGGAPLGIREALFFNGAGFNMLEGYGLTESSSVASVNLPKAWRRGSVGRPLPGLEVRIADDGEILMRGPSIMRTYWRNDEATASALVDGWLHTGDVGRLDEAGFLYIRDRKKDIIINAQAKKIAPQVVESRLRRSPLVTEAVVVGDRRPFLGALVFPDLEMLRARLGLALSEGPDLVKTLNTPAVLALVRAEVDSQCATLAPHEQVRNFTLLPEPPTIANGLLTPTLKVRRSEVIRRYAAEVAGLYRK